MELPTENALVKWSVPECPFTVEYSPRVLDDIRLAVTDAFFSLPRGGAEIGGLLLGRHDKGRVTIVDSVALDCEHAFGPSFVLSDRDHARLTELIAAAAKDPARQAVGWWHSHTRSEVFLSEADQQIHNSFFPEPWQVAAVLKPHTFQPTRLGFFFREADGSIRGDASYREDVLQPLPMKPAGAPAAPTDGPAVRLSDSGGRVIDVAGYAVATAPVETPAPVETSAPAHAPVREVAPPAFLAEADPAPREPRRWIAWVAVVLGVALGVHLFSDRWLPGIWSRAGATSDEAVSLNTADSRGELQVRWNGAAPPVRSATAGSLLIVDGSATATIPLDAPHVHSGALTYRRKSDRVDVTLALVQPGGKEVRVATLFTGDPPPPESQAVSAPASESRDLRRLGVMSAAVAQQLTEARAENASTKAELARQVERNKVLQKALDDTRQALRREQQRKRLEAQSPDGRK